MRWLRRFFYSENPILKLADGLSEFEAGIFEELLLTEGIVAVKKNMEALYDRYWRPMLPSANHFALYVKPSDLKRAREVLAPLLKGRAAEPPSRDRREYRRRS